MSILWEPIAPPNSSWCKCACALTRPWFLVVILFGEMITFQSVCLRYVKELQRAQRQALPECKQKIPRSKYTDREWKTQRIFGFSPASFCISTLELFGNQKVSRKTSTRVQWNLVISVFFFIFHQFHGISLGFSGSTKLWSAWIPCEVELWRVWRVRRLGEWSQSSQAWPSLKRRRNQRRSSMRKVSECRVPVEVKQRVTETHKNLQLRANFWIFLNYRRLI